MTDQRPTRRALADQQSDQPAFPLGVPAGTAEWDDIALKAYIAHADVQIAALEPAGALLPLEAMSTPELDELSAASSPEAVAQIEERIRQRIASRQEQRQIKPRRKVQVTK
jgi:hypothetical protein